MLRKYSRQETKHLQLHVGMSVHITDLYYRLKAAYSHCNPSVLIYKHIFEAEQQHCQISVFPAAPYVFPSVQLPALGYFPLLLLYSTVPSFLRHFLQGCTVYLHLTPLRMVVFSITVLSVLHELVVVQSYPNNPATCMGEILVALAEAFQRQSFERASASQVTTHCLLSFH